MQLLFDMLDSGRGRLFAVARGYPMWRRLLVDRNHRITVVGLLQVLAIALVAATCPIFLFFVGPALWGVLHVAADIRYLVLRQSLASTVKWAVFAFSLLLIGLRAIESIASIDPLAIARLELVVGSAWLAGFTWFGRQRSPTVRLACLVAVSLLMAAGWFAPGAVRLIFAGVHPLVAIAIWQVMYPRSRRAFRWPLLVMALCLLGLGTGVGYRLALDTLPELFGVHLFAVSNWVAPGLAADVAIGLTSAFVLAQAMHYAIWLIFIPQDDLGGSGLSSFRATARSWERDFGKPLTWLIAVASLALVGMASIHMVKAVRIYLSVATFHGYLELAMLCYGVAPVRRKLERQKR